MRVAINLSAHQMRQDDIVERITDALQAHKIHPSLLTCENTESAAMEDTNTTQTTFRRLGELGTHLSIDDFGTGYSSLSYLRKLPAEELMIDRSFIEDLEHRASTRAPSSTWSSSSPTRLASMWSPRASRTSASSRCWCRWAATSCRGSCSPSRCRRGP